VSKTFLCDPFQSALVSKVCCQLRIVPNYCSCREVAIDEKPSVKPLNLSG